MQATHNDSSSLMHPAGSPEVSFGMVLAVLAMAIFAIALGFRIYLV